MIHPLLSLFLGTAWCATSHGASLGASPAGRFAEILSSPKPFAGKDLEILDGIARGIEPSAAGPQDDALYSAARAAADSLLGAGHSTEDLAEAKFRAMARDAVLTETQAARLAVVERIEYLLSSPQFSAALTPRQAEQMRLQADRIARDFERRSNEANPDLHGHRLHARRLLSVLETSISAARVALQGEPDNALNPLHFSVSFRSPEAMRGGWRRINPEENGLPALLDEAQVEEASAAEARDGGGDPRFPFARLAPARNALVKAGFPVRSIHLVGREGDGDDPRRFEVKFDRLDLPAAQIASMPQAVDGLPLAIDPGHLKKMISHREAAEKSAREERARRQLTQAGVPFNWVTLSRPQGGDPGDGWRVSVDFEQGEVAREWKDRLPPAIEGMPVVLSRDTRQKLARINRR